MDKFKVSYIQSCGDYICQILAQTLVGGFAKIDREHLANWTNDDVTQLSFSACFPSGAINEFFTSTKKISINSCAIKKINMDDLMSLGRLTSLRFAFCVIEYVPGNIYENMPNLEEISFYNCKIKYLDSKVLDGLTKLKIADFRATHPIDAIYRSDAQHPGRISLEEFKLLLQSPELQAPADYDPRYCISAAVIHDLNGYLMNDNFKDVTITAGGEIFKAHRAILIARCPLFASVLKETSELKLYTIKSETFAGILDYLYTEKYPQKVDQIDLVRAAGILGLLRLSQQALENLAKEPITEENAIDILSVAKAYGKVELQKATFEKIQEMMPFEFKDVSMDDLDELKKILDAKKVMDKDIGKAKEKFDKALVTIKRKSMGRTVKKEAV